MVVVCQKRIKKRRANEVVNMDLSSEFPQHRAGACCREGEQKGVLVLLCKHMNNLLEPLRKKEDITYVLRRGKRAHSPLFRLYVVKKNIASANKTGTRLGVIVGKAVSKKAVERNRIRRRTREAFRRIYPNVGRHMDIIIMPTKKVLEARFEDIVKYITKALR